MKTLKTTWTGIRPLVMHNGFMADHTNPLTKQIKDITSKGSKKMQEPDYKKRDRLEWEAGLYWDDKCGLFIPAANIERCIQLGAQKKRLGKDVQAVVFVSDDIVPVKVKGGTRSKEALYKDPAFTLRVGVAIQKSRIIRIRPMIPTGWELSFTLEYDEDILSGEDLIKAMQDAGALVGLGDWRPKFGRFLVA
jgi:hypothetical protein